MRLIALFVLSATVLPCAAQALVHDARLDGVLKLIQAPNIEARVRKLVSFHTRHTLSRTDSDTVGIGAARRWIKAELDQCSRAAGGRLRVEFDSFVQQP